MGLIYKVINDINDLIYIGKTSYDLKSRWNSHLKDCKIYPNDNNKFHNAIRKYGAEHFFPEVIEDNIDDSMLNEKECYYIRLYNSYLCGYNSTWGGEGDNRIDHQAVMKLWNEGKTCTEIGKILNCTYTAVMYVTMKNGVTHTERKGRSAKKRQVTNGRLIEQYDLNGVLLKTYDSSGIASEETGILQSEINRCCSRYRNTYSAGGYIWKAQEDSEDISVWVELNRKKFHKTRVAQYNSDGEYIQSFESFAEAARITHANSSCISEVVSGERQTANGYIFKLEE